MAAGARKVAEGRLERTVPIQFSIGEGLDIGMDTGSAVDFTYQLPFKFRGDIKQVTVDLAAEGKTKAAQKLAADMSKQ